MNWLRLKKHYWQSDDGTEPSRYIVKPSGSFPNVVAEEPTREAAIAACDAHRAENP